MTRVAGARRVLLVRHGQSEANIDKSVLHRKDHYPQNVALTKRGHEQAAACGIRLARLLGDEPYAVYRSPYLRARQTWEVARLGIEKPPEKVVVDGRLREQEYKDVTTPEELAEKKRRAKERGRLYYRYKGAESGYDVLNRVGNFYNQLRFDMKEGNTSTTAIVVCHEVVMRCFLIVALELDPDANEDRDFRNCQVVTLTADARLRFGTTNQI